MAVNRAAVLAELKSDNRDFDVIVIGGGITGAGVAREAAGSGLKTLLVEQKDFAWGTSSRSSKMVHGGLRYLSSGHYALARDAVRERQRLLNEAPGLIEPLRFIMPHFRHQFPGPRLFQLLLRIYDRISRFRSRQLLTPGEASLWVPGLASDNLAGASGFTDAVADDARLVQKLIAEARRDGALCVNYVKALSVERHGERVTGVTLQAEGENHPFSASGPLVINATGVWANQFQPAEQPGTKITIRPLRGSHLVLPWGRLPVSCCVSLLHPDDKRPVFAFPWQGTTVLGTTDLDHSGDLNLEPAISRAEVDYLLEIADQLFPGYGVSEKDIVSTWAGVRPVVSDGTAKAPSRENREHELREENGLISIAGGKLTTFRLIAREALTRGLRNGNTTKKLRAPDHPVFTSGPDIPRPETIGHLTWKRLKGYYSHDIEPLLGCGPLNPVHSDSSGNDLIWAEIYWACKYEDVQHLDDLLLRRTRLGLTVPDGAESLLPELRRHCQALLGWDDDKWLGEQARYLQIRNNAYSLPGGEQTHVS
ncbi:FAD-dependent oxidoreductase [Marinobacter salinus]|uniref:FAD-dependent oxidoreductase n=1 Tax=Marinobacter salinus TaxID=1874317 RepID=A0A1D9GJM6_9GAMM|nr:glycerol-3-phosphate dehydrogenase/oxidase [Marinobacter salinus]AOY87799.1 FAD-dependent oxidoreductase [Marinobacter salinus]